MNGKIDFIICEHGGGWYIESLSVPEEVASETNAILVEWAKRNRYKNDPDIIYIGVYWRDVLLDECGISDHAILKRLFEN